MARIALLMDGFEAYGLRTATEALVSRWAPEHACVAVMLADGPYTREWRERGREVVALGFERPPMVGRGAMGKARGLLNLARYRREVRGRVRSALSGVGADLVLLQYRHHPALLGGGRPGDRQSRLLFLHAPVSGAYPFDANKVLLRRSLHRAGVRAVANSAHTAASLAVPGHPVAHVHLGVDADRFRPGRAGVERRALGIPEGAPVFLVAARLVPEKGQEVFARALLSVEEAEPAPHLVLLGGPVEGGHAEAIRALGAKAGGRIHLLGPVPDPERHYGLADVAVNSRITAEAFGLSLVEAMAAGLPVLAHSLGGPSEIVADGRTGWLCDAPTVEGFAAAIRRALSERERWAEMGRRARAEARERFSPAVAASRLLAQAGLGPPSG